MCGVYVHVVQLNTSTDAKIQFLFLFIDWFLFTSPKNNERSTAKHLHQLLFAFPNST